MLKFTVQKRITAENEKFFIFDGFWNGIVEKLLGVYNGYFLVLFDKLIRSYVFIRKGLSERYD